MASLRASTMDSVETSASTTCVTAFLPSQQAETVNWVSLFSIKPASSLFQLHHSTHFKLKIHIHSAYCQT